MDLAYKLNNKIIGLNGKFVGHSASSPYPSITIGSQIWMLYNISDNIANSYVFNDNESNRAIYGGLYTWDQIPTIEALYTGWHVPSETEFNTLITNLGGTSVAGGHLKEAGTSHWSSPNTGADNISGFTALPGGLRYFNGAYYFINTNANFWSSTSIDATYAKTLPLVNNSATADISSTSYYKTIAMSIRLLKNV